MIVFLFSFLLALPIFALNSHPLTLEHVKSRPISAFAQQFEKTRAEYIHAFDSFLQAYGEGTNHGQFPDYSFTEKQFLDYQAQFTRDYLGKEKSPAYSTFRQKVNELKIITLEAASPALWKHIITTTIIDLQILEQYNEYIKEYRKFSDKNISEDEELKYLDGINQTREITRYVELSVVKEPVFIDFCQNFILFMIHGTRYSFETFKKDINEDDFFKYLIFVTANINLLKEPKFVSPVMPIILVEKANADSEKQQLDKLISSLKTIGHSQGMKSVVEFNNLQMATFVSALTAGGYTMGPDDIVCFEGPNFSLTFSQMRFLKGYEQIGFKKNKQNIVDELSEIFSKNSKILVSFLEFSESAEYIKCSTEDLLALRKAVFEKANTKNYKKNLLELIEANSGENLELDKLLLDEMEKK